MPRTPTAAALVALALSTHAPAPTLAQNAIDAAPRPNAAPRLPDHAMLLISDDAPGPQLVSADRPFFSIPNRPAYQNIFDRTVPLDAVPYLPGPSNVCVDVTTRLAGDLPPAVLSFAIVNRNSGGVRFDATMTLYPDADGAPDVAHPILVIPASNLFTPGRMALGVARIFSTPPDIVVPAGTLWFGVSISNLRGGDPSLFGQIVTDTVGIGSSSGTLLDLSSVPPGVLANPGDALNVDRMIIPWVECKPDWDMNGRVDLHDARAFAADFVNNPTAADYNLDGATDITDYSGYAVDYFICAD